MFGIGVEWITRFCLQVSNFQTSWLERNYCGFAARDWVGCQIIHDFGWWTVPRKQSAQKAFLKYSHCSFWLLEADCAPEAATWSGSNCRYDITKLWPGYVTVGLNSQTNLAIGVYVVCNIANIPIIAPTGVYSSPFGCAFRLQRNSD